MATLLGMLVSCFGKHSDNQTDKQLSESLVGSTWENINNSPHNVVQFEVEGKVCFATINQFFKNYKDKRLFPNSLWVKVETLEKNEYGHPLDKEADLFNQLEDSLIGCFVDKTPFCFIGRTTRDGFREIMIYVSEPDKAETLLKNFVKENKFNRSIQYEISFDPNWESVEGLYYEY